MRPHFLVVVSLGSRGATAKKGKVANVVIQIALHSRGDNPLAPAGTREKRRVNRC